MGVQGARSSSWFSSHPSTAHREVAKQLCAGCIERTLIHMLLPAPRALVGRPLPGYGAHLGRHPAAPGALVADPSQGMEVTWTGTQQPPGLSWAGPSQGMELTWAGTWQPPGLLWSGSSQDTELTWAGTRQGWAHRNRARSPRCRAPQPTCWSELTLSTSEQDLN